MTSIPHALARCLLASVVALALPTAAVAGTVPGLDGAVTDLTGSVGLDEGGLERELEARIDDTGVQLFALFVENTGDLDVVEYAEAVAEENSLGVDDALLVVAVEDRTDAIWVSDALTEISDDEIDQIIASDVEPRLRAGDFGGAVLAASEGLGEANGTTTGTGGGVPGGGVPGGGVPGGGVGQPDTGGGFSLLPMILVLAGGLLLLWWFFTRRPGAEATTPAAAAAAKDPDKLFRDANRMLIETDDAVRDAEQELGFAEAQFGETEVEAFRSALREAAAQLQAAFTARQRLDDDQPEDAAGRQALLEEIIGRCTAARQAIDAQRRQIEQLRDLERNAPAVLEQMRGEVAAQRQRASAATATMARLEQYAAESWASVRGNVVEAEKRLTSAEQEVARADAALAKDDRRTAGRSVAAIQRLVRESAELLDAVERLAQRLDEESRALPARLQQAADDLAAARSALTSPGAAGTGLGVRLEEAERLLADARRLAQANPPDVMGATSAATRSEAESDAVLEAAREVQARAQRAAATRSAAIQAAAAAIDRADDYIALRRFGVGRTARTRLAEAQRRLDIAAATADPVVAAQEARNAHMLADEAYRVAASDFDGLPQGSGYGAGGGGGDVVLGAILGSILGGGFGGGWSSGWGGTSWGSPFPSGRRRSGGGIFGGGGGGFGGGGIFGGGGGFGRARGGSFGGVGRVGGRARGGRW